MRGRFAGFEAAASNRYKMVLRRVNLRPRGPRSLGPSVCRFPHRNTTLLFRIDKISLGVSRIGVATPRDDCPYAKSNDNTLALARAYRVFLTSCVGINLGDIPRGLRHPRDVPSVDPSTLGQKPYTNSLRSCIVPMLLLLLKD